MNSKKSAIEFLQLCHKYSDGYLYFAKNNPSSKHYLFELEPNIHLLNEINEPIQSIEKISSRIIVFNLMTKCIILCASDDDGDGGCDSHTKFIECNFDDVIGKVLKSINHKNVTIEEPKKYEKISTHTYELIFDDDHTHNLELINTSNGFYDGCLEVFICLLQ
jgi:hypothetical protein